MTRARTPVMHGHIGSGKASRPAGRFADLAVGTDQAFLFLAVSAYPQLLRSGHNSNREGRATRFQADFESHSSRLASRRLACFGISTAEGSYAPCQCGDC
jgi:hypothetical protein